MAVVMTGGFDADTALKLTLKHFGSFSETTSSSHPAAFSAQSARFPLAGLRSTTVRADSGAAIAWRLPGAWMRTSSSIAAWLAVAALIRGTEVPASQALRTMNTHGAFFVHFGLLGADFEATPPTALSLGMMSSEPDSDSCATGIMRALHNGWGRRLKEEDLTAARAHLLHRNIASRDDPVINGRRLAVAALFGRRLGWEADFSRQLARVTVNDVSRALEALVVTRPIDVPG